MKGDSVTVCRPLARAKEAVLFSLLCFFFGFLLDP
jgi:hypothetical protein